MPRPDLLHAQPLPWGQGAGRWASTSRPTTSTAPGWARSTTCRFEDIIAGQMDSISRLRGPKFNSPGQEAHTPGDYACLNLNIFTKELRSASHRMPHRMFVSVSYEGDGSDQLTKTASKTIELREAQEKRFLLAAGLVRPHYPMVQPKQYFDPYPWQKMALPSPSPTTGRYAQTRHTRSRSELNGIAKFPTTRSDVVRLLRLDDLHGRAGRASSTRPPRPARKDRHCLHQRPRLPPRGAHLLAEEQPP